MEKNRPGGVNVGLIDQVARYSLDHGYHVVLDGIFYADRYEQMLAGLGRDHLGWSCFYYLDVSLEETLRRHAARPQAAEFGADDMRDWYRPRDLLATVRERVIPETSTQAEITSLILAETQLPQADAAISRRGARSAWLEPVTVALAADRAGRMAPRSGPSGW
jgi:hypothetical protein